MWSGNSQIKQLKFRVKNGEVTPLSINKCTSASIDANNPGNSCKWTSSSSHGVSYYPLEYRVKAPKGAKVEVKITQNAYLRDEDVDIGHGPLDHNTYLGIINLD